MNGLSDVKNTPKMKHLFPKTSLREDLEKKVEELKEQVNVLESSLAHMGEKYQMEQKKNKVFSELVESAEDISKEYSLGGQKDLFTSLDSKIYGGKAMSRMETGQKLGTTKNRESLSENYLIRCVERISNKENFLKSIEDISKSSGYSKEEVLDTMDNSKRFVQNSFGQFTTRNLYEKYVPWYIKFIHSMKNRID